jgi:PKD repeat protein
MTELGALGGPVVGLVSDINDAGQVVGSISAMPGGRHAFVWTLANGAEDLYATTGMTDARAINNRGQVVGGDRVATLRFMTPNRAPVASVGGLYTGTEGSAVTLAFSATDADGDALTYSWDLGDGATGSGATPPAAHVYADDGTYAVRLTVTDGRGGADTKTTTATIANVAPAILAAGGLTGPATPVQVTAGSASAPVVLAFTDPAGTHDTYAATIECGNESTLAPSGITSPYAGACTYTSAGVYTVRATVTDEDGGTSPMAFYRYVIVYDPDGASATGGGFYAIPGQAKGNGARAHFAFSTRFLPGRAGAPNGTVRFWIPGGQLDFVSTAIEMLVAAGNRAQFWGTGTLDGAPARFRITAVDGQPRGREGSADAFRIELWRAGTLVFDTQPGAAQDAPVATGIEGGNIQIRR